MKTTDFQSGKKYVFVVPVGSTEQHGPFLPLGTDSFVQDAFVHEAEKQVPYAIFLPTIRISCSEEHDGFPGTVFVSLETMKRVLVDVCKSLLPYASHIILTTAHGGNVELLRTFAKEHAFHSVSLHFIDPNTEETDKEIQSLLQGPVDEHAGNYEISMMLAIDESITSIPPSDYPKKQIENPFRTNRLKDFSEDGIADNHPSWVVSKEHGTVFLKTTAHSLAAKLGEILDQTSRSSTNVCSTHGGV